MSVDAPLSLSERVSLASLTTLGVGGPARWFADATTALHVSEAHAWRLRHEMPLFVLAGGSNVVVSDEGFNGLVLRIAIKGLAFKSANGTTRVVAGAGERWDGLVEEAVARGLAGVECLSGIPGTVGGTPIQNVGAYGQEVADVIESVTAFDTKNEELVTLPASECGFSYRMSRFKAESRYTVTRVTYRLAAGEARVRYPDLRAWLERAGVERPTLSDVREAVLAVRRTKGMVVDASDPDSRSVGSFFMNPIVPTGVRDEIARVVGSAPPAFPAGESKVKIPAAWLIERAGFEKGHADGAVGISTKHPLALVNRGGATARDVLRLAVRIKRGVADAFGIELRPEPIFVGFTDDPDVTYLLHG